jgi:hypothetical protein
MPMKEKELPLEKAYMEGGEGTGLDRRAACDAILERRRSRLADAKDARRSAIDCIMDRRRQRLADMQDGGPGSGPQPGGGSKNEFTPGSGNEKFRPELERMEKAQSALRNKRDSDLNADKEQAEYNRASRAFMRSVRRAPK